MTWASSVGKPAAGPVSCSAGRYGPHLLKSTLTVPPS